MFYASYQKRGLEVARLGTWDSLHQEHLEIFTKVNLLEKALLDFLQKGVTENSASKKKPSKAFLNAFEQGILLHFAVEEKALFPHLRKVGKNAEKTVEGLLVQHQFIMEKYNAIIHTTHTTEEEMEILLAMIKKLGEHTRNEELFVPPLIKQMSLEQLGEVDQAAKRLGYTV
jgi:hemerythrin-like domain-containing protein